MNAGRRVLLSAGFLALAVLLTDSTAKAQNQSHQIWQQNLTPEQIKAALAKMSSGDFGGPDLLQQMFKDHLLKNNPNLGADPKQVEELVKKFANNPKLMEQLKPFIKKQQKEPGRPGQPTPDDFRKWADDARKSGDFPKLPPNIKGFEPPKFVPPPKVGPMGAGVQPNGDPMRDPMGGNPMNEPPPKVNPPVQPGNDPPPAQDPNGGMGNNNIDQNPFLPPERPTDPREKSLQAFQALWERNIGPMSETPEVEKALFSLVGDNGFDFDFTDANGNSIWDLLKYGDGDGSSFGDLLNGSSGGNWSFGNWEMPRLGNWFGGSGRLGGRNSSSSSWNWGSSRSPSSGSSSGWGGGGGIGGLAGAWLPFVVLMLVILGVFIWFQLKNLSGREASVAFAGAGIGPWPVDPRSINTREDVVLAFEYLSVLICGPSAKNWTHGTIAAALTDLATTHEETALMLARLYELARYAPLDEPLTHDELVEARKLVCGLAGVSY